MNSHNTPSWPFSHLQYGKNNVDRAALLRGLNQDSVTVRKHHASAAFAGQHVITMPVTVSGQQRQPNGSILLPATTSCTVSAAQSGDCAERVGRVQSCPQSRRATQQGSAPGFLLILAHLPGATSHWRALGGMCLPARKCSQAAVGKEPGWSSPPGLQILCRHRRVLATPITPGI